MTTILYHQDKLLGDSRRYEIVANNYTVFYKQKVFLHPSKLFAYGVCGDNLPYDDEAFADVVKRFVREITSDLNFKEMFPYKNLYILVMMRHITFTIYNNGDKDTAKQLTLHNRECSMGYGTGAQPALMAITAGATIEEAMSEAVLEDMGTGGDLYGVRRESLISPPKLSGEKWKEEYDAAFDIVHEIYNSSETVKEKFLDPLQPKNFLHHTLNKFKGRS